MNKNGKHIINKDRYAKFEFSLSKKKMTQDQVVGICI